MGLATSSRGVHRLVMRGPGFVLALSQAIKHHILSSTPAAVKKEKKKEMD